MASDRCGVARFGMSSGALRRPFPALRKPFVNHNRCKTGAISLSGMAPVRVARAFRLSIIATMTALALSGCMRTTGPVAVAPQSNLDSMAYGQPYAPAPVAVADSAAAAPSPRSAPPLPRARAPPTRTGRRARRLRRRLCRTGALRCGLSSRCRRQAARRGLRPGRPHQYLCDRCRRLDHHAADRLGSRARPHAGGARRRDRAPGCATDTSASLRSPSRSKPTGRSSSSVRSQPPGSIPYVPNMTVESAVAIAGGFSPRAGATASRSPIPMPPERAATSCRPAPRSAPAIPCWSANAGSENSDRHACEPGPSSTLHGVRFPAFFVQALRNTAVISSNACAKKSRLRGQAMSALVLS